jgi:hypothetical protein
VPRNSLDGLPVKIAVTGASLDTAPSLWHTASNTERKAVLWTKSEQGCGSG